MAQTKSTPDNGASPPAKGRQQESVRALEKSRRGLGKPGNISELNFDVLYLIRASLLPLDLLNLARTCKFLRGFLMSESSAFVWRAARFHVKGLPDCPADLSEPAYANLVFYTRCHVCGKYAPGIYWYIRRRYCPDCRCEQLREIFYCPHPQIMRNIILYTGKAMLIEKIPSTLYDKELVNSVVQEYERSSNKEQFLEEKREQYRAMNQHARDCKNWRREVVSERRNEQKTCRRERIRGILERLEQLGYEREVDYFGHDCFQEPLKRSPKPLTDQEWALIMPKWLKTMNDFRRSRLDVVVYQPRRHTLMSEYEVYMKQRSPDAPTFDLLPHVADLACLPPFRDVIDAPEETQMNEKPFAPAFAQLPVLVDQWRQQLDAEIAELVKIPPLSLDNASSDPVAARSNATRAEVFQTASDKLRLACALFHVNNAGVFTHPEIFSASMLCYPYPTTNGSKRTGSFEDRFGILFLKEAPCIVHACELDPNVATVGDMDHRDARLRCLVCKTSNAIVMSWRDAMLHARSNHRKPLLAPLSEPPRWQLVSDEYIDMIRAVEESINRDASSFHYERCLLCLPHVGDAMDHKATILHLWLCHEVKEDDIKRGVHYVGLGMNDAHSTQVEMVEEGGQVTFRKLQDD